MTPPALDPWRLLRHLSTEGVEMVLIGGMAIAVHGITHVTEDLDVCYETSAPNCERLVRALAPLHPRPASAGLTDIALQEKK